MITLHFFMILASLLFCLGLTGLIIKRQLLVKLMCLVVLFGSVNLIFVVLARYYNTVDAHSVTLFSLAIVVVEFAVGLGLAVVLFRNRETLDVNDFKNLKG